MLSDAIRRELENYEGTWVLPDDLKALLEIIEAAMGAEPAKVEYSGNARAHFNECWRYTNHHACAVAEIERLQKKLAEIWAALQAISEAVRGKDWLVVERVIRGIFYPHLNEYLNGLEGEGDDNP